ncbi:unnamed protein product [Withania somnifera]
MGGLGKMTLAQIIFNDLWVNEQFDLKIRVCVSYKFDEKRLIRAILEAIVGKDLDVSELASLQNHLITLLRVKRYLLVLDDVWNEDQEKWDKLKALLTFGSKSTSVITTTRLEKVASIMGIVHPHRLSCLSEYDYWLLFKKRAFGLDRKESPNLVDIGKEIVRRCCGVPLAAKALGSILHFKKSEFWNFPQDESSILPALRLSYFHLPQDLRHCFAYCAIFEKGSKIDKEELVYFWMANGFISSEGNLEPEDRGNEVWNELYWRFLFLEVQQNSDGRMLFKIYVLLQKDKQNRHFDLVNTCVESLPQSICSFQNLQMLSVEDCCLLRVLPKHLRNLRHLRLRGCPLRRRRCSNVGELRDLNLQGELVTEHLENVENHMEAKEAPSLKQNLRSLALYWIHSTGCESSKDVDLQVLEALEPHSNLKHLKVSGFSAQLASWMRHLILRSIITLYIHDCKYCLHLPPLAQLPCLKSLSLRGIHMEYIDSDLESGTSQLRKFPSLESLEMCNLPNLKGCPLLTFPRLLSVRNLRIMKCSNMTLASISNLCSLSCLDIANNKELTSFPDEVLTNLTNLETLLIPALKSLPISFCNRLKFQPEPGSEGHTSVRELSINSSDRLKYLVGFFSHKIKHLNSLLRVHLDGLPMFHSGEDTVIDPEEFASLQLPEALRYAHNLQSLSVCRFQNLTLLPEWLGEFMSLKELNIVQCDNLASLPEGMERMNLQSINCDFFGINLSLERFTSLRQFHLLKKSLVR